MRANTHNVFLTTQEMTTNIYDLHKLDEENIHELVSGIQKICPTGITQLPSRDITLSTENKINDLEAIPNHVPRSGEQILDESEYDHQHQHHHDHDHDNHKLSSIYDEIQGPLFICLLYLLFQLPVTKRQILHFLPSIFLADGNYNIYGHITMSILFTVLVYCLQKYLIQQN